MKVLVFGGSGFLGSFVADELTLRGHDVTIFDEKNSPYLKYGQKMILGNILDREAVDEAVRGQQVVYNFAGLSDLNYSIEHPISTLELNIMGNTLIVDACARNSVERFIYASTVYVFSQKGSFYGVSKRCSEKIIEEYGQEKKLPYTIIRYGSVYGPRSNEQNRIFRLLKEALGQGQITFQGSGEEEREYIHVTDAARLSVDILSPEYINENIMLTGTERLSYKNLLRMIQEIFQDKISIQYKNQDYKGHYQFTPYSFSPRPGKKLTANPHVDFGQGLISLLEEMNNDRTQNEASFLQ